MGSRPSSVGSFSRQVLLFLLLALLFVAVATADSSGSGLRFLVIGDWGSADDADYGPTQRAVANAMAQIAQRDGIGFVVSVGDNFYDSGVSSVNDPKWNTSFGEALQKRWYQMLGNHDYKGNVNAQLQYKGDSRWYMPSRNYSFTLPVTADIRVTFIVIDTTPFVNEYYNYPQNDEMRNQLRNQHWEAQLSWLKQEFEKVPKKNWLIVFGHHPVYSGHVLEGHNEFQGGYRELQTSIQPLLEQHGAATYIAGHVHDLEHLSFKDVHYFISGAGSRIKLLPRSDIGKANFHHDGAGFMAITLLKDNLTAVFYDQHATVLYSTTVNRRERPESMLNFQLFMEWNSSLLLLLFILGFVNVVALIVMLVMYVRRRRARRRSMMIPMRDLGGAHFEIGDDDPEAHSIGAEELSLDEADNTDVDGSKGSLNGNHTEGDVDNGNAQHVTDEKEKEAAAEQATRPH